MKPVNALEATGRPTRVRLVRSVHQEHAPRVLVTVNPEATSLAVTIIRDEVIRLKRTGAGCYLFIDSENNAYVLSELRSVTATWLRERFGWLVACYAPRRRDGSKRNPDGTPYLTATVAGITEDVTEHLADLARVAA